MSAAPPYLVHKAHESHRLKNASPQKQEHARLEVENAEDDLVQKTEVAITLMKTVLENVDSLSPIPFPLTKLLAARANQEPQRAR